MDLDSHGYQTTTQLSADSLLREREREIEIILFLPRMKTFSFFLPFVPKSVDAGTKTCLLSLNKEMGKRGGGYSEYALTYLNSLNPLDCDWISPVSANALFL